MSGSGSTVEVSVMPVGSGTVGLLPMNGYPSPAGAVPGAAAPGPGCSGKPKCGAACWRWPGARLGGKDTGTGTGGGRSSAPAVGGGAESGGRPAWATGWAWACHCEMRANWFAVDESLVYVALKPTRAFAEVDERNKRRRRDYLGVVGRSGGLRQQERQDGGGEEAEHSEASASATAVSLLHHPLCLVPRARVEAEGKRSNSRAVANAPGRSC